MENNIRITYDYNNLNTKDNANHVMRIIKDSINENFNHTMKEIKEFKKMKKKVTINLKEKMLNATLRAILNCKKDYDKRRNSLEKSIDDCIKKIDLHGFKIFYTNPAKIQDFRNFKRNKIRILQQEQKDILSCNLGEQIKTVFTSLI